MSDTKYVALKKELKMAMRHWDAHPLSGSAKTAYIQAKQNMIDYYNELCLNPINIGLVESVEKEFT